MDLIIEDNKLDAIYAYVNIISSKLGITKNIEKRVLTAIIARINDSMPEIYDKIRGLPKDKIQGAYKQAIVDVMNKNVNLKADIYAKYLGSDQIKYYMSYNVFNQTMMALRGERYTDTNKKISVLGKNNVPNSKFPMSLLKPVLPIKKDSELRIKISVTQEV